MNDFALLKNHLQSFFRYFLRHLCFLPLFIIMFLILFQITGNLFEEKTAKIAEGIIQNGLTQMEINISACESAAESLASGVSSNLLSAPSTANLYSLVETQRFLMNVTSPLSSFTADIGLLCSDELTITPKQYFLRHEDLLLAMITCQTGANTKWPSVLRATQSEGVRYLGPWESSAYGRYEALTYVKPITLHRANRNVLVFFANLPTDMIEGMFLTSEGMLNGTGSIYDRDGTLLLSFGDESIKNGTLISVSGDSGLSMRFLLSSEATAAEMALFRTSATTFIGAYLLLSLISALFFALQTMHPLMKLTRAAEILDRGNFSFSSAAGKKPESRRAANEEYRYILTVLSDNGIARKTYEQELGAQEYQMRQLALISLLTAEPGLLAGEDVAPLSLLTGLESCFFGRRPAIRLSKHGYSQNQCAAAGPA